MTKETNETTESQTPKKFPLKIIRGLPFPEPFLVTSNVESAIDFKPKDTDIFVVTYPKCGTTWTQFIVWEILHKGVVPPSPNQMMFRHFSFLEFTGTDILEDRPAPRTMKTHLPFNLQPYNPRAKYIYIVRNPWDCCVSYYYHHKLDPAMPDIKFDDHFESFIKGEVGWGDFFDHVLSWFEHRNDPNVLFLTYEDMKKDKRKTLLAIAKFLGDSYYESLQDEEVVRNCLKHTDFKYMKELGMFFPKGPPPDTESKDQNIESKDQSIESKDQSIESKTQSIESKDQSIESKGQSIESKDQSIESKTQSIESKEQSIGSKGQSIKSKDQSIESNDQSIESKDQSKESKTQSIESKDQSIESKYQSIESKDQSIESKTQSTESKDQIIKKFIEKMGEIDRSMANSDEFSEVNFFRKGEVGDWKNHFSLLQVKKFNEYMLRKLKNTPMASFWQPLFEETEL